MSLNALSHYMHRRWRFTFFAFKFPSTYLSWMPSDSLSRCRGTFGGGREREGEWMHWEQLWRLLNAGWNSHKRSRCFVVDLIFNGTVGCDFQFPRRSIRIHVRDKHRRWTEMFDLHSTIANACFSLVSTHVLPWMYLVVVHREPVVDLPCWMRMTIFLMRRSIHTSWTRSIDACEIDCITHESQVHPSSVPEHPRLYSARFDIVAALRSVNASPTSFDLVFDVSWRRSSANRRRISFAP